MSRRRRHFHRKTRSSHRVERAAEEAPPANGLSPLQHGVNQVDLTVRKSASGNRCDWRRGHLRRWAFRSGFRIPHGVYVDVSPELSRDTFGLPHDRFLFYMMHDVQSRPARKNPQAAINAFKLAFPMNTSNVGLVLKINNAHVMPADIDALRQMIQGQLVRKHRFHECG